MTSQLAGQRFIIIDDELDVLIKMHALFTGFYGAAEVQCICTTKQATPPQLNNAQFFHFPDRKLGGELLLDYIGKKVKDITSHFPKAAILCNDHLDPSVSSVGLHSHYSGDFAVEGDNSNPDAVFISDDDFELLPNDYFGITGGFDVGNLIETLKIKNPFIVHSNTDMQPATMKDLDGFLPKTVTSALEVLAEVEDIILNAIAKAEERNKTSGVGKTFLEMVAGGSRRGFNIVAGY